MSDELADEIRQVAQLLAKAQRVCCLTGAGVSAERGVPTFRDAGGLWEGRRPEDVATPEAFRANPQDVWDFYLWRRRALSKVKPNAGHHALAAMERLIPTFTLVTQNVDGLHRLAGSELVYELHGDMWVNRCTGAKRESPQPPCSNTRSQPEDGFEEIPHCPLCGSMMRPGVVWFGEMLPEEALAAGYEAAVASEVMLVVGTASVVHPAASLPMWAAEAGAVIVEVNPNETALSPHADYRLSGPSGEILPAIVEQMKR